MQSDLLNARPLPGWGSALRPKGQSARAAAAFATFCGVTLCACTPAMPPAGVSGLQVALSRPAGLRSALQVAFAHVNQLNQKAGGEAFHLVRFTGQHLDANGASVVAWGSGWTFTFSRYAGIAPSTDYDVVTVEVPGSGYTTIRSSVSSDPGFSPLENWDDAATEKGVDSVNLLAPFKAAGVSGNGAAMRMELGVVTIEAGGQVTTYQTNPGTFTPLQPAK